MSLVVMQCYIHTLSSLVYFKFVRKWSEGNQRGAPDGFVFSEQIEIAFKEYNA